MSLPPQTPQDEQPVSETKGFLILLLWFVVPVAVCAILKLLIK
jgi:hypothetical protein